MRKALFTLVCLVAMVAAGTGLKAQEVTITLNPGWNWISNPSTDTVDFATVLGPFTPMSGDAIKSQWGNAYYRNGRWAGSVSQFYPGWGYKYYSNRTTPAELTLESHPLQLMVITAEPTGVTAASAVVGGTVTIEEGNHIFARGMCWGIEPNPDIDGSCMGGEAVAGSQSLTLEGLTSGTTYYVRAYAVSDYGLAYGEVQSFTTEFEYVDLDLPSGTLWATCNVGANTPEEYGDYFAWGETEPKNNYSWSTYQYCNGSSTKLTRYCNNSSYGYNGFTDSLSTLLPEDDAATANWGDDWCIPTKEEWQELYDNTTCIWTTQNGVDGRLFTAANGNSLFLPAAGYRNNSGLSENGVAGDYLSSSLYTSIPSRAWELSFGSDNCGMGSYGHRKLGLSVRPVRAMKSHDYVDLGLPSGTLWATCNVGADTPEDYGDYFGWGETQPKEIYNYSTYQHCNSSANALTKYCNDSRYGYNGFTDDLTILLPEDDAATVNWGNDWRMPVKEEWQELFNYTDWGWTTQNGVYGILFTGANGNSLFLPSAGCHWNSDLFEAGNDCFYWSSSLNTDSPQNAWRQFCDWEYCYMDYCARAHGQSVRAVRSFSQNTSFVINVTAIPEEGGSVSGGGTYQTGTECTLTATPNEGYTFVCWMEYGFGAMVSTEATYSFTVNKSRNLRAIFCNYISGAYHYVDLGLPSGILWATCNVGAETPESYGDYFAWGEIQPKDYYSFGTYQYSNGNTTGNLTKYCNQSSYGYNGFTDNLTILQIVDDAATMNWGLEWRMPTVQEWDELTWNTTNFLTTLNGVDGCLFIAANGNTLFLPAADHRSGDGFDDWLVGNGYYWSSSLALYNPNDAYYFSFGADTFYSTMIGTLSNYRFFGQSVRAVRTSSYQPFYINATSNPVEGGWVSGEGPYLDGNTCTLTATANEGYFFINWTENGEVVSTNTTYSFSVNGDRNLVANFAVSSSNNLDYVDLGLPSGLLWATRNVGSNSVWEYGDYFAWGETQPDLLYLWDTYQYCYHMSPNMLTKYCTDSSYGYNGFIDNIITLLTEDDAASVNMGADWRMPTKEEWQELYNNTTSTWTTQNGVNGWIFIAPNGNNLFLPAAGFYLDIVLGCAGSDGYYWSSSLDTGNPSNAWLFNFNSGGCSMSSGGRPCGLSVRAVRVGSQN